MPDEPTSEALASPWTASPVPRPGARLALITVILAVACSCSGCPNRARLTLDFETDATSSAPKAAPDPSPPHDTLTVMTRAVTPIVTGHPGGGQWLSFTPTLPTLDNPSARTLLLAATSERFTTSPLPLIGGSLLLRIDGPAIVIVGVAATNGSPQDFLGGIRVVTTNDPPGNNVHLLPEFTFAFAQTNFGHPAAGNLGSYKKETELTINWNLNQNDGAAAQGSFEAAISGGAFSKTPFQRTAANGFVRIPVQQLSLWVWLQGATDQTRVYLDAIYAYERKP